MDQADQYEQLKMLDLSQPLYVLENSEQYSGHQDGIEQVPDQTER